jgi:riboflavin synthase
MFTGIISDLGSVKSIRQDGDTRFEFNTGYDADGIDIGASIACSGACLTVTEKGPGWFAVDASAETLQKTILGDWQEGTAVNFERALKLADELGGHLVSGHVDGVALISDCQPEGDSLRYEFEAPGNLMHLIAPKGSVALDGVSLTVNEVVDNRFGVNIIPHTQQETSFGSSKIGQRVNLEIDLLARYVARILGKS